jgi:acetylornithine deacetylase/succinyl-diaminopimelate desuccinylase-like protein
MHRRNGLSESDSGDSIDQLAANAAFRDFITTSLVELCAVDTTAREDVDGFARAEAEAFDRIERCLTSLGLRELRLERAPIAPGIRNHPFFSKPYYTSRPIEQVYQNRFNLLVRIDGDKAAAGGVAFNVHIDTVRPHIPPRVENGIVYGRGACDDKGPLVSLLAAIKLVAEHLHRTGTKLEKNLTLMFVIEEEIGGNGSLSLALDRDLRKRYDNLLVLECTSGKIHPGNRGAVWYKVEARAPDVNLFEAAAFAIEEMEKEGRAIRDESAHELFPHRPVQTCHGILGNSGEHPSRINGLIEFIIAPTPSSRPIAHARRLINEIFQSAIAEYVEVYGDKTKLINERTAKPKVDHHYDVAAAAEGLLVRVHGSTGHMGSIRENDGAITKMATLVRALINNREKIQHEAGVAFQIHLTNWDDPSHLIMEGGQGFLPTHSLDQVQTRLRAAVWRGGQRYFNLMGLTGDIERTFNVTYDKLHNAAFAGRVDSPALIAALAAAEEVGLRQPKDPVRGWDVSCDARIFACEYPDLTVLTAGPGHLVHAHADDEQINIEEIVTFARFLARFILNPLTTAGPTG